MREHKVPIALALVTVAIAGFRIWYSAHLPLSADEAYYWTWSRDIAMSYHDHPPLTAWLIGLGTTVLGSSSQGIRLVTVLLGTLSLPLCYSLGRELRLAPSSALMASLTATLMPAVSSGSLMATPDAPVALCWLLSTIALARISRGGSPLNWYLLGASLGLGLLAKHSALLVIPATLVYVLPSVDMRGELRRLHPWFALALAVGIAAPFLLSEGRAGFPSFTHQLDHLAGRLPASPDAMETGLLERVTGLLGGQIGLLTPPVALVVAMSLVRFRRLDVQTRVLLLMTLAPVAATLFASLFTHPEQNWASTGHPIAAVLFFVYLESSANRRPLALNTGRWSLAAIATAAVFFAVIHVHALSPFLPLSPQRDPVTRIRGWEKLPDALPPLSGYAAVVCDNYGLAAMLAWSLHESGSPPVVSTDRGASSTSGDWLVLDELGDWGGAEPRLSCLELQPLREIALTGRDGETLRTIVATRGVGCTTRQAP